MRNFISVLLLCITHSLTAQNGIYHYFDNLTEKDGLSNNNITCLFQDKRGFMWIGTQNGLNRYDGSNIKIYTPAVGQKQHLSNGFVTAIDEDDNGHLWVATRKGLNRIDKIADTTEIFLPGADYQTAGLPNDLLWDVLVQNDTAIWVAVDSRDLCRYNPKTHQFTRYGYQAFINALGYSEQDKYHSILRLARKSGHELWLGTTDGILSFNSLTGRFTLHYAAYFDHFTFFSVDTASHSLLFVEENNMLCRYQYVDDHFTATPLAGTAIMEKSIQPDTSAYWLPSQNGIVLFPKTGSIQYHINSGIGNNNLLPGKVNALFTGHDGITWAGTENGISKYLPPQKAAILYKLEGINLPGKEYALNNLAHAGASGAMYIAAPANNKVYRIEKDLTLSILSRPPAYEKDTCYGLYYDKIDTLYLLCRGNLLLYSISSQQWKSLPLPAAVTERTTTVMQKDAAGNYWIGTRRNGLWVYYVQEKRWWQPSEKEGFYGNIIYSLLYDAPFNTMWIGTFGYGLSRYDAQRKTFTTYLLDLANNRKLQSSLINDLASDGKGNIWIATTEGGLSVFNYSHPPGQEFTTLGVQQGLPDNNIYSIGINSQQQVWFSSIRGIGIIGKDRQLQKLYDKRNIFSSPDFFNKMVLYNSTLYTSYDNMLLLFNNRLATSNDQVSLLPDKITVNDTANIDFYNKTLLELYHADNTLSFAFTAPHFINSEPLYYQYKLEGLDNHWSLPGTLNQVRYSSLSPGHYVFKAVATDRRGTPRSNELSFSFTILPPFWYRWWFILLCAGSILAAGIYWQKRREKRIHQQADEKSRIEKQMAELEIKALRSQMNPHFIFNSLNSISMLVASQQNEKGLEYLNKFSRLLRIVLEESENNFISLKDEIKMLDLYLQMERLRFKDSFYYTITADDDLDEEETLLPAMIVHPLAENAVWHGLLHKEGTRRLIIHFHRLDENRLQCSIRDNGIGLQAASRIRSKAVPLNSEGRTSKGLQLVKDRLALLEGQYRTTTSFSLEEVHDENGLLSGTKATIEIPIVYEP